MVKFYQVSESEPQNLSYFWLVGFVSENGLHCEHLEKPQERY